MNANISSIKIFDDMKFDLIITLTYILMDNVCFDNLIFGKVNYGFMSLLFITNKNILHIWEKRKSCQKRNYCFS